MYIARLIEIDLILKLRICNVCLNILYMDNYIYYNDIK